MDISKCQCCKRIFTTKDEITQQWFCFYCDACNQTQWKCSKNHESYSCSSIKYRYCTRTTKKTHEEMKINIPILSCPCCGIVFEKSRGEEELCCKNCELNMCPYLHTNVISTVYLYRFVNN